MSKGRVLVAMSGGVDSSVAALLLTRQGYDVFGVTMRLWTTPRDDLPPLNRRCCSVEDADDARRVCDVIGIPHYVQNFERQFKEHVVDYFVGEYARGRTPNPCLACNDRIKFDSLLVRATALGADFVATGHYARVCRGGNSARLLKGVDSTKDQSYVLFTLGQPQLRRLLLPIGGYRKDEVRRLAAGGGLPVADKPDSQDICFIPDGDYRGFMAGHGSPREGDFVDRAGKVMGHHPGIQFFTVGQRRGLGLRGGTARPTYVVALDPRANRVVLGRDADLARSGLRASRVTFVAGEAPLGPVRVDAKIRSRSPAAPATLFPDGDAAAVTFDAPQRAVAPGQAVVFYAGDEVLGGGYIEPDALDVSGGKNGQHPGHQDGARGVP